VRLPLPQPASLPDTAGAPRRDAEAEARASLLAQILTPEAAERLGRIRLVKAARATDVESRLIMLARSGQLRGRVTEEQLKEILGAVAEHEETSGRGKITVERRKGWDDEGDGVDDLLAELDR
jgi:programmed cell death protein 5